MLRKAIIFLIGGIIMAFTAADVKKLREMTDCGMMECKKALTDADGDMDKAVEILREKGLATAAKKAGRVAAEGVCAAYVAPDGACAGLVEVNIETDFAANNADFLALGGTSAMIIFIAVCASIAMLFPISTPPNAIASATGMVETKDMTKVGLIIGIVGFVLGYFWLTKIYPFA